MKALAAIGALLLLALIRWAITSPVAGITALCCTVAVLLAIGAGWLLIDLPDSGAPFADDTAELSERLATTGEQRAVREPLPAPVAAVFESGTGDETLPAALQEPVTASTEPLYTDDTGWRQYAELAELLAKQEVTR